MFHNPVRIHFGSPGFDELSGLVQSRRYALVTTPGMERRGVAEAVGKGCEIAGVTVFTGVQPNPTIESIELAAESILDSSPDLLIALGGGSAIDTAKGVAAIASSGPSGAGWFREHLTRGMPVPSGFVPLPLIAIPTTAGTGSEVTMWGTVWNEADGTKHSISHPRLFPEAALLVPELTLTCSRELTLFTALDTVSHCMESIWNRRATPVSDAFAVAGLAKSFAALDRVLDNPEDLSGRRELQHAALFGGLAISSNATALAHSLSYPLTSHHGMPHGLACSFTLPEIIRFNAAHAPGRVQLIADVLGARDADECATRLESFFIRWDVAAYVRQYVSRDSVAALRDRLLTPGRADNNIRPATPDDALGIVSRAIH